MVHNCCLLLSASLQAYLPLFACTKHLLTMCSITFMLPGSSRLSRPICSATKGKMPQQRLCTGCLIKRFASFKSTALPLPDSC